MSDRTSSNFPWLDRLTMSIPGYGGYDARDRRRAAAFALRDALCQRLSVVRTQIDQARASCQKHEALSMIHALDRVGQHLDHIIERVGGLGTRVGTFYEGPDLDRSKLDPIYALDHAILEEADEIVARFGRPDVNHNLLAEVEADLNDLENRLDERALMLRKLIL